LLSERGAAREKKLNHERRGEAPERVRGDDASVRESPAVQEVKAFGSKIGICPMGDLTRTKDIRRINPPDRSGVEPGVPLRTDFSNVLFFFYKKNHNNNESRRSPSATFAETEMGFDEMEAPGVEALRMTRKRSSGLFGLVDGLSSCSSNPDGLTAGEGPGELLVRKNEMERRARARNDLPGEGSGSGSGSFGGGTGDCAALSSSARF
jgi:hypothetical protein